MLGPSSVSSDTFYFKVIYFNKCLQSALIHVGGRYPPCMKIVKEFPLDTRLGCLNDTSNPPVELCSVEEICGFGGFHGNEPNQWFRYAKNMVRAVFRTHGTIGSSHRSSSMVQSCVYLSSAIRYVDIHQYSAGIIHLALNMLAQMTASAQV
jgi:hypothetical protein